MTQRSIVAGLTPTVIIRAGVSVSVDAWDSDRVLAETESRWGLKVERGSENQLGRLRAKVGERVLLDVRADLPKRWRKSDAEDAINVQFGGSGRVQVPPGSSVKVYAGQNVDVQGVNGRVSVYSGGDVRLRGAGTLTHASTGGELDVECEAVEGDDVKLAAGRDLRCYIRALADARVLVDDVGGSWAGLIGSGRITLRLKSGGDVTLVTGREVVPQAPDFLIGRIEKPNPSQST